MHRRAKVHPKHGEFLAKQKQVTSVTNKASLTGAPPVRPVKETLTKTALINLVAEQNDLPRKTAASVYATLEGCSRLSTSAWCWRVHLARTLEVSLRKVPARKPEL